MRKTANFDTYWGPGWPKLKVLEPYFLGGKEKRWVFKTDSDDASLNAQGADGTEHLEESEGRVDVDFFIVGHPNLGVLLMHKKYRWGGGLKDSYVSKGNLTCLDRYYRDSSGSLLAIGLFIPFEDAWKAVKEFIETDGALPKSIDWIADRDLPPDTFPDQSPSVARHYLSRVVLEYRRSSRT